MGIDNTVHTSAFPTERAIERISMPDFPATPATIGKGSFVVSLIDAGSETASVPFRFTGAEPSDTLLDNARRALGNLSNAAVYETELKAKEGVPTAFVTPFDEAFSSINQRLNLLFVNTLGERELISVPAPDASYFVGGVTMIQPDGAAAAGTPAKTLFDAIVDFVAVLNASRAAGPARSFRLSHGYKSNHAGTRGKPSTGRQMYAEEPAALALPGPGPDADDAPGQQDEEA